MKELLDVLTIELGCNFISELPHLDSMGRHRLAQIIKKTEPDDYPIEDWNGALSYLTGEKKQETAAEAKKLLCQKLSK